MKRVFSKPYSYWFIGIFVLYILLNILISGFYNTAKLIIIYASTVDWITLGLSLVLTLVIGFLVALNSVYVYILYKERKKCTGGKVLAGTGTIGGLIVGVCPLCITGLVALVLGFIGIGFSFASLPFDGVEIQILVIAILVLSLYLLRKKTFK